jgi:2-phospho-L-lactate/phosphoenolpyruvate guanylyltransferase
MENKLSGNFQGGSSMTLWAIVPVKPLRRGKSRLASVLSQDERAALNQSLLQHTLDTLKSTPEIEQVLVVSRDLEALALARMHGARTVQENGAPHLNVALTRATVLARNYATRGVLVVPADLPLLNTQDLHTMIELSYPPKAVVVAPDRRQTGTNALLISPLGIIPYEFGPDSFQRHCNSARHAGARLEICELPALALDVDLPEDLNLVEMELSADYESVYHMV